MATVQTIYEGAIARSTANDPGKLVTDGEAVGVLDRIFQCLYAIAAMGDPSRFLAKTNLAALSSLAATLPVDTIEIRRITSVSGSITAGAKIRLIPAEEVDYTTIHLAPAVYRQGASIVSRGGAGDPANGDVLAVTHIDAPTTLSALGTTIDARFPARYHELLVLHLAIYMATKDVGARQSAETQALITERKMYLEMFLQLCNLTPAALQTPHGNQILQRLDSLLSKAA